MKGHFEAKKHAIRQTQDGWVVSFVIHPDDVAPDFAAAPLGTIFMVGYQTTEDAEEAPVAQPGIIEEGAKAAVTRAAMLCQDKAFQEWFMGPVVPGNAAADTAAFMRTYLCVASRSEIATNPVVLRRFLDLERQYQEAMASA